MANKTAIVTGGARGLGAAMVLKLGEMGYNVVINDLNEKSQADIENSIQILSQEYGVQGVAAYADVSTYEGCQSVMQVAVDNFGDQLDVLISNAGITNNSSFLDITVEAYTRVINTNLLSMLHMAHVCMPHLVDHDSCIVNTASIGGLMGVANQADYCAAKAGVIGLTRALAVEFAPRKVRVNAIAPGMMMTDMLRGVNQDEVKALAATIPLGKIGEPSDIAQCMEYLVSSPYVTGQTISPNGGIIMP